MTYQWAAKMRSSNKPKVSGGVSRCVHCGAQKVRVTPPKRDGVNLYPRTVRAGCPKQQGRDHQFATEVVQRGWSGGGTEG